MIRDFWVGRLGLPTVHSPVTENLGSDVATVGEATAVGQRRVKGFALTAPIHGTQGDTDLYAAGNAMRRQFRSLIQNPPYRLAGVYVQFKYDVERNGWFVFGDTEIADDNGGPPFAEYTITFNQAFKVAEPATHREGFRVDLTDVRSSTSPIDYQGTMVGAAVGFAGLTALALAPMPVGASDVTVLEQPVTLGSRSGSDGTCPIAVGNGNGDVISWERAESDFNKGDVVIYDRKGNTTANPSP